MPEAIKSYLDQIKIGRKQSFKNLAMFPLLSTYCSDLDYLLLDEALREGLIEVAEVSEEGSVPELKVTNRSPHMVLILDGEELVGAKQNRIVNTTILLKGNATIIIPVSCVEHGRWSYSSQRFTSEKRMMSPNLRFQKAQQVNFSIRTSGEFRSDQGALWDGIAEKAERMHVASETGAMASIFEKERVSLDSYVKHFRLIEGQVGAVFMINGKVVGMDALGKPETLTKVFEKLIQSYALDAVDWFNPEKEHKYHKSKVTAFVKSALSAHLEPHPSVGLGTDIRMESKKITGFALALDNKVLHVSLFAKENGDGEKMRSSRIHRYSRRRRNRIS